MVTPHLTPIFPQRLVPHPVQPVLDPPVPPYVPQQLRRARFPHPQAGNPVTHLVPRHALFGYPAIHPEHLAQPGPIQVRVQRAAGHQPPPLDPTAMRVEGHRLLDGDGGESGSNVAIASCNDGWLSLTMST